MNKISCVFLLITLVFGCSQKVEKSSRKTVILNKNWSFQKGDTIDNSLWEHVHIPHTTQIEPLIVNDQWQGASWYRKILSPDNFIEGKNHFLKLEGVMQEADVWINQHKVAKHQGGYLPFTVDITKYINRGQNNTVLVKVINSDNITIPPGKPLKDLDFNTYGGIYRNVHLISTNNTYISNAVAANKINGGGVLIHFNSVSDQKASGFIKIHVVNKTNKEQSLTAQIYLKHKENEASFITKEITVLDGNDQYIIHNFEIDLPKLWSPETPNLYDVTIVLKRENAIVDEFNLKTGIRSIQLNEEGFFLNGKKRFINGTNRHQEYPYVGYAISDNANYRDAYKIKQAGFDFVRLSHYPQSKSFLNACDELGLMVMNCIPGWQYFEQGVFEENAFQDIRDMVRRDRNHPSIIFWENSLNESGMTNEFMVEANNIVKEELPYTDTYTAGWIDHPSYDLYIPARQHGKPPHYWNQYDKNGRKVLIAEYGDWEYYAQNAGFNQKEFKNLKQEERTSRQLRSSGEKGLLQQALNYQEAFNSNTKGKHTIGQANWLMFDYNRGYADDIEASGISDIFRIPKFASYFYKSQKSPNTDSLSKPMAFIANHWNKESSLKVKVFSNCDEVALYLNEELVGKQKPEINYLSEHLKHPPFIFNIPNFQKGTLKAIAYINNKEVALHSVTTSKIPVKIKLTVDESGKAPKAGEDDLVFVYAKILDKNDHLVTDANNEIDFLIKNDNKAKIIGPKKVKAEAGIATILLRTFYSKKEIEISATSNNLSSENLVIFKLQKK